MNPSFRRDEEFKKQQSLNFFIDLPLHSFFSGYPESGRVSGKTRLFYFDWRFYVFAKIRIFASFPLFSCPQRGRPEKTAGYALLRKASVARQSRTAGSCKGGRPLDPEKRSFSLRRRRSPKSYCIGVFAKIRILPNWNSAKIFRLFRCRENAPRATVKKTPAHSAAPPEPLRRSKAFSFSRKF